MMRVLIACERFGAVRDAFLARGHDAVSCDLYPTESPGPHITGDVFDFLDLGWDMMIAFPDCTFLTSSGLHWNYKRVGRHMSTLRALDHVERLLSAPIERIALENPQGCIGTKIRKASQYIQPYEFGADASKRTGLWLKNLPLLRGTKRFSGRIVTDPKTGKEVERWSNQTDGGQNRLGPSDDRAIVRGKTYPVIANAMADQWG